jgi:hypothetical protein
MDEEKRKSRAIIRVEFLDSTREQMLLGNYLKDSGESKTRVLNAVATYFLPFALAENVNTDGNITRQELEFAARKSRRKLLNQISNLDDFFRINYQIDLQSDRPGEETIGNAINSKNRVPIIAASPVVNEDDDSDDEVSTNNFEFK